MNVQKTADHNKFFTDIEQVLNRELPLLELNFEFGKLLDQQPETSAIAAAAEYMADQHPEMSGFSPRSLRRMRAFYRAYKNQPNTLRKAMNLSWTQNIVIFEADLTNAEREWYIIEACKFGWSKQELTRKITEKACLNSVAQEPAASDAPDADTAENAPQPKQTDGKSANRGIAHKPPEVDDFRLHLPPRDPDSPPVRGLKLHEILHWRHPEINDGVIYIPTIRPINVLNDTERIDKLCWQKGAPVFLTKDGYAHLVIMSLEAYEQQMNVLETFRRLTSKERRPDGCRSFLDEDRFFRELRNAY